MKESTRIQLRLSEIREKLNDPANSMSAEERSGIEAESLRLEREYRSALTAESRQEDMPTDYTEEEEEEMHGSLDSEEREMRALGRRVRLSNYVSAAIENRAVSGVEAEFNAARKVPEGQFPLSMLARGLEVRTKTDADTATNPIGWLDRLFADTAADHLGITMAPVSPGTASYPVTTGGGSGAQRGREQAAAVGAWTIGVETFDPTRMTIHYEFAIEDAARIPGLEAALERDLRMALRESMDRAVFNGDTGANEDTADVTGFFGYTGVAETTLTQANKVKYDKQLEAFVNLLDGIHAESLADLRVVGAVGWNKLVHSTVANSAAENDTIATFLRENGLSWRTRGNIEDATGNGDFLAAIGLGRGIEGAGVCPVWENAMLIRDHYSNAKEGKVLLTLHVLWNWGLVRTANFKRLKAVT